jgi:hypothetical protein
MEFIKKYLDTKETDIIKSNPFTMNKYTKKQTINNVIKTIKRKALPITQDEILKYYKEYITPTAFETNRILGFAIYPEDVYFFKGDQFSQIYLTDSELSSDPGVYYTNTAVVYSNEIKDPVHSTYLMESYKFKLTFGVYSVLPDDTQVLTDLSKDVNGNTPNVTRSAPTPVTKDEIAYYSYICENTSNCGGFFLGNSTKTVRFYTKKMKTIPMYQKTDELYYAVVNQDALYMQSGKLTNMPINAMVSCNNSNELFTRSPNGCSIKFKELIILDQNFNDEIVKEGDIVLLDTNNNIYLIDDKEHPLPRRYIYNNSNKLVNVKDYLKDAGTWWWLGLDGGYQINNNGILQVWDDNLWVNVSQTVITSAPDLPIVSGTSPAGNPRAYSNAVVNINGAVSDMCSPTTSSKDFIEYFMELKKNAHDPDVASAFSKISSVREKAIDIFTEYFDETYTIYIYNENKRSLKNAFNSLMYGTSTNTSQLIDYQIDYLSISAATQLLEDDISFAKGHYLFIINGLIFHTAHLKTPNTSEKINTVITNQFSVDNIMSNDSVITNGITFNKIIQLTTIDEGFLYGGYIAVLSNGTVYYISSLYNIVNYIPIYTPDGFIPEPKPTDNMLKDVIDLTQLTVGNTYYIQACG